MNRIFAPVVTCLAALLSGPAMAGYTLFEARDNNGNPDVPLTAAQMTNSSGAEGLFRANLTSGVGIETFEGQTEGTLAPLTLHFVDAVSGSDFNATLTGDAGIVLKQAPGTSTQGRYSVPVDPSDTSAPNGSMFWDVDFSFGQFEVRFDHAIAAFGFYGIDIGDFSGAVSLELLDKAGKMLSSFDVLAPSPASGADGSVLFMGILADSAADDFWGVRFVTTSPTGALDAFGFDNFSAGERCQLAGQTAPVVCGNGGGGNVPLPGTVALLGAALLGLGAARRRA